MRLILAALALLLAGAANAQVNKCLDKSGKVVAYGAECPPGTTPAATGIRNTPAPPAASSNTKSSAELDAEFRKRRMETQESSTTAEKKAAEAAQKTRACEEARSYLKGLEARNRISRTDPKTGERVWLEEADYERETARARNSVATNCAS